MEELETVADKLFYTFTHISEMEERPASFSEKVLVKLFELCRFANMTPEEQYIYIRTLMAEVDARSQRRTEINKATAEARAETKAETTAEIARSLREKGIPTPTIAEACGLTEEQILAL